jgi:hypothetical protein
MCVKVCECVFIRVCEAMVFVFIHQMSSCTFSHTHTHTHTHTRPHTTHYTHIQVLENPEASSTPSGEPQVAVNFKEAFYLATVGGARVMNLQDKVYKEAT